MNLQHIIREMENIDPELPQRLDTRREAMKSFASFGKKLAVAAVPIAFGAMFKKAYGQSSSMPGILDVLNFALTLEYLEATFYEMGNAKGSSLIPTTAERKAFMIIGKHEMEHVDFLKSAISASGGTPVKKPDFDFTAGGLATNIFSDYETFLAASQSFEDLGVRAYKGQAGNLMSSNTVLTAALNIHSVEARHASKVRMIRQMNGFEAVKPWITLDYSGINHPEVQPVYAGEDNTTQAGVQIIGINNYDIDSAAASEAFDEPLSMKEVLPIVSVFIKH